MSSNRVPSCSLLTQNQVAIALCSEDQAVVTCRLFLCIVRMEISKPLGHLGFSHCRSTTKCPLPPTLTIHLQSPIIGASLTVSHHNLDVHVRHSYTELPNLYSFWKRRGSISSSPLVTENCRVVGM